MKKYQRTLTVHSDRKKTSSIGKYDQSKGREKGPVNDGACEV